ncbi:MAG TPA: efflux transporter outer membrane subunit [Steroidobacteraceae bacterium]|jgi:NodT family efflux transporter outer membrane factor (OMF) lipoprotein|nr:efflux transporter outer membrane subunit [Steroidobacteraceae bacterium]
MSSLKNPLLMASLALLLGGCMVGPDYHGAPQVTPAANAFVRATDATPAAEPEARWWTTLADPELNRLIDATLATNPGVDAARARVREARANLRLQTATGLPTTGTTAAYLHSGNVSSFLGGLAGGSSASGSGGTQGGASGSSSSGSSGGGALNLYVVGFDATWELDFFGGNRRAVQGAAAGVEASEAQVADAIVSLTAEVTESYIELCDARQRLTLTQKNIDIESRLVDLMKARRAGGAATDLDVVRIANQLDTTRALLPGIRASIAEQLNRLAALTARAPGALDAELANVGPVPAPPATTDVGDPAALLRRRPDIRTAERQLAQHTAAVGQSVAAQFPKVTLLGTLGFFSTHPQDLFNSNSFTYLAGPMLQWTPLDFGRNRARVAQANAARDEAEASYRQTVLNALADAETALARYGQQRDEVADLGLALASAEETYRLTDIRLRGGTAATTDVLDADTRRNQAELSYEQALAQLTQDYVALQKSLGLGWTQPAGN